MRSTWIRAAAVVAVAATAAVAQTSSSPEAIYNETKRLPAGCVDGYTAGTDTLIYTIPYTYEQVLTIIGSYKNLTWSGNPDSTVTLNGTDNTPGTARFYTTAGASVIETLSTYSKPAAGPYVESHTLAPLTIPNPSSPSSSLSFYAAYDANTATPVCNGAATMFNETVDFCATDATAVGAVLHALHLQDVKGVGALLGNASFTTCEAAKALHPGLVAVVEGGNGTNATNASTTSVVSSIRPSSIVSSIVPSVVPSSIVPPPLVTTTPAAAATPAAFQGVGSVLEGNVVLAGLVAVGVLVL